MSQRLRALLSVLATSGGSEEEEGGGLHSFTPRGPLVHNAVLVSLGAYLLNTISCERYSLTTRC